MKLHHTPRITSVVYGMTVALLVMGITATVIVTNVGSTWAEQKKTSDASCSRSYSRCWDVCNEAFGHAGIPGAEEGRRACGAKCKEGLNDCNKVELESKKSSKKLPTTPLEPTKAGQNIGSVGGTTRDPTGGGTLPKIEAGQKVGKVGGVKRDPMKVRPTRQPVTTGGSTVPKTKVGEKIGKAGGVKKVEQGWSSPSTSGGGTILMKRSSGGRNKDRKQ